MNTNETNGSMQAVLIQILGCCITVSAQKIMQQLPLLLLQLLLLLLLLLGMQQVHQCKIMADVVTWKYFSLFFNYWWLIVPQKLSLKLLLAPVIKFVAHKIRNADNCANHFIKWCIYDMISILDANSLRLSDAYMRRWTGSSLVQIMACRLFGAKPLSEPMLEYS